MSIRIETSIWIDRPASHVFNYITEPSNLPLYMPGMIAAKQLGTEKGVGTQIAFSMVVMGQSLNITSEWTRFEQDRALGSKNLDGSVGSEVLTTLHEENGGTRVERVLEIEPHGILNTLATPFIRRTAQRNAVTEFAALKDVLESAEA